MLLPPPWLLPLFIGHNSIIVVSATLCGPLPSTCLPAPPCPPPLIPPPLPPAPPPPQLPCPMPCPPPHPPAPPPPLPQLPCPSPCPPPLPSLPPAPPPLPLPQLPCPSPCPPPTPPSPYPLPPPRLPTPNCPPPPTTYQPFLPQPAQNQYQTYLPSPQVPYAPNQQQIVPPSYSTRPIPIPLAPQPVPQSNTYQLPQPSPYATQPGLSYGYGYGRQSVSPYYNSNPYQNPIPAKERFVHNPEEKEEQTTHEKVKDPFEKIEDNEAENKSGGDERTKTTGKQRINPQFQRDDNYIVPGYARPTTPIDVPLPKPMSPIIYPTPLPVYQQRPPPLQQMLPATIYQPSPQPISQQWQPYPQQLQCPPCPLPSPQPLPPPPQPAPIQNCCLRCPYTKTTALLKSYGVKTITKPYLHSGISSSVDELAFHTKKRDEGKCNDKELAAILGEVFTLKMNLAKEAILDRVEKRLLTSSGLQRPNILFHVVCAPRMLEYIVRSEKFCAGDVADGICFVFRTGQ